MKTSQHIINVLKHSHSPLTLEEIARVLPGFSKHQISCSLTRLIHNKIIKSELEWGYGAVNLNNKRNLMYSLFKS